MRCATALALLVLASFHAQATQPYTITPLILEGDTLPGVGIIQSFRSIQITDDGDWIAEAFVNGPIGTDYLVIRNGAVFLREGDPLPAPPGTTADNDIRAVGDNDGNMAWFAGQGGASIFQNDGLYHNDVLVLQEGDPSIAPQFAPGTTYTGGMNGHPPYIFYFLDLESNDLDQIALRATFEELDPAWNLFEAVVRIGVDGSGVRQSESVAVRVDQVLPGQIEPVQTIANFDLNNAGQVLYDVDMVPYFLVDQNAIYLDDEKLAQVSDDSPVFPRQYAVLGPNLSLNNHGDHVFGAELTGDASSEQLLVKNGAKLIQGGDTLPAIAPFSFIGSWVFGKYRPVAIDDNRNVLWYGAWNAGTNERGLFLNEQLIVQKGLTEIGGLPVFDFRFSEVIRFSLSDNGRFIAFLASLNGGQTKGAYMLEVVAPPPVPDGRVVAGTQATAALAENGTDVHVVWDATSCPAAGYNLMYGSLADVEALEYSGADCGLGTSGSATFTPPPGDVFWILVGVDAEGRESSHGFEANAAPRDVSADGMCGVEIQVNASACPAN
jgi:hypothetical protein